jgi:hypothetical protein
VPSPTTATDYSGNGHNGVYAVGDTQLHFGVAPDPYGGTGSIFKDGPVTNNPTASVDNSTGWFDVTTFTCEAWVKGHDPGGFYSLIEILSERTSSGPDTRWIWGLERGVSSNWQIRIANSNSSVNNIGATWPTFPAAWHHIATTYTGGTWTPYLDGSAGTPVSSLPINTVVTLHNVGLAGDLIGATGQQWYGGICRVAFYGTVLSAARIAAHASAANGPAYTTAVLADSPLGYWILDDGSVITGGGTTSVYGLVAPQPLQLVYSGVISES